MDYFKDIVKVDPVNHYLVFTKERLKKLKANLKQNEIKELEDKLSYLLTKPQFKVTDKSKDICLGFSSHNYMSLATYYWPNPQTPDNLPYIQKDGYPNPEGDVYDKDRLRETAFIIYYELLLYYLTENTKYYFDMKRRLTVFFLLAETRMLPNMNHAQIVKGKNLGRGIGIIDFSANMSYAVILLKSLYDLDFVDMGLYNSYKTWLTKFLNWLRYDKIAVEEMVAHNNHGTMYDFLLMAICYYLNLNKLIPSIVYNVIENRMLRQFADDGSLPYELARTKSKSYSLMGLKGFTDLAILFKEYDYDLYNLDWYFKNVKTNLLKSGIKYMLDNLILVDKWSYEQIAFFDEGTKLPIFLEAYENGMVDNIKQTKNIKAKDDILKIIITKLLD